MDERIRCPWGEINARNCLYHDTEWGVPVHDDRMQFEHFSLEVMQCGLSWDLMLKKRTLFRNAFADFEPKHVADMSDADVDRILDMAGMIRSERKVRAIIHNARLLPSLQAEFGSFSDYIWQWSDGKMLIYRAHAEQPPAKNSLSERLAKDLKKRGFRFVGPVNMYAHLQSCGVINDHHVQCFRYEEVQAGHPVRFVMETDG